MKKYSLVAKDECIACGVCNSIAPDIFAYDDDGYSENIYRADGNSGTIAIEEALHEDLIDAHGSCPTGAIKVSDVPFS